MWKPEFYIADVVVDDDDDVAVFVVAIVLCYFGVWVFSPLLCR